jgi:hypothetical protein
MHNVRKSAAVLAAGVLVVVAWSAVDRVEEDIFAGRAVRQ